MEKDFFSKNQKCSMLVIDKTKSFDKNFKGDFNLENNLINRKNVSNLKYIYTGMQIIKPEVFSDINARVFSINKVWNKLIENNELCGTQSKLDFFHVSTLDIYKNLLEKKFKH